MADGLVTASYATDPALLDELRWSWPPAAAAHDESTAEGYRPLDLTERPPDAAIRLSDRHAVAFVNDGDGWLAVLLARRDGHWTHGAAGDGASAFVAGAPAASERRIAVDQTNVSVVVGERVVVKWFRRVGPGPARSTLLLAHLDGVGFRGIPQPLGAVTWQRDGADAELVVAQGAAYLPDASDGWTWAVEGLERGALGAEATGHRLGGLVGGLHRALATPTPVIAGPFAVTTAQDVERWRAEATTMLDEAMARTDGPDGAELRRWKPAMRGVLDGLATDSIATLQPVHGDLHIGQVLEWPGGLAVIDFDGNPALGDAANALRQPVERDVAQMLMSLDHVGRIVQRRRGRTDSAIDAWIATTRAAFLEAYGPVNADRLGAFEVEQECRELVYAARFLPRWRYAPMAALRARFGTA